MCTRWIVPRTAFLTSSLLVAGIALACLLASADAAPPQAAKRAQQQAAKRAQQQQQQQQAAKREQQQAAKREQQKVSNTQLHEALRVLQATKKTLESANHDYGGHRAEAVKAIGAAQHQLKLALGSPAKPKKPGGKAAKPSKGGEPQNISNMQLAEAIPILQKTKTFVEKANHDYHGHRAAAVRDLNGAIKQLKLALKFEMKK